MDNMDLYNLWAPPESPWSVWAKPVLFATMDAYSLERNPYFPNLPTEWTSTLVTATAVIIDLPGEEAVFYGLSLYRKGYQPVPLFNGCPGPSMLVNVTPIVCALVAGADVLVQKNLSTNPPPAFLLDSNRLENSFINDPGRFDNRWFVVPQDMPSADFLKKAGINSILLCSDQIRQDLAHILYRYQKSGIQLKICYPRSGEISSLQVQRPSQFGDLWYRWQLLWGLRRNSTGGFGAVIPTPNSGGGFG
jgi:hypothetical protein